MIGMKMIKVMKQLGLELRVHASSALVLLTLDLLFAHFTQEVAASKRVMTDVKVDTNNCSINILNKDYNEITMKDYNEKFIVSVETNDCQRCKEGSCRTRYCRIKFVRDKNLKTFFKICVETKAMDMRGCDTRVTFGDNSFYTKYVLACRVFTLGSVTSFCFAHSDFLSIKLSSDNFCDAHGHLEIFFKPISPSFYDLTSVRECYGMVRREETNSGTILSSFNSDGQHFFCEMNIFPTWKHVEEFCIKFGSADFPLHGAQLTIDTSDHKWEFNHKSRPPLQENLCTKSTRKHMMVRVFINSADRKYENRWNHAFAFSFVFKEDWDGNYDYGDSYEDDEDSDWENFPKKIIISVAVICAALFICCFCACRKSNTTNSNTNATNLNGDSGLGENVARAPYYESNQMGTNEEAMPINRPARPAETASNNSTAAYQQPPPDYGQVAASSPPVQYNTAHSGQRSASGQVLTEEERYVPPPEYDSLFPDRKDN